MRKKVSSWEVWVGGCVRWRLVNLGPAVIRGRLRCISPLVCRPSCGLRCLALSSLSCPLSAVVCSGSSYDRRRKEKSREEQRREAKRREKRSKKRTRREERKGKGEKRSEATRQKKKEGKSREEKGRSLLSCLCVLLLLVSSYVCPCPALAFLCHLVVPSLCLVFVCGWSRFCPCLSLVFLFFAVLGAVWGVSWVIFDRLGGRFGALGRS